MNKSLKLATFLPYRLSVLSNRLSRDFSRQYQERFNLTIPEWRVMAILGETPGISAREVAEKTAMDKVAVSRAVAGLKVAGYIARKINLSDKRKAILSLSKKGQATYAQVVPVALAYEASILEKLSAADKKSLDNLLTRLGSIQADL